MKARVLHQQGVAIRLGTLDLRSSNIAVAAPFVFHHDGNGICALRITSLTPRIEQRQDMLADILRRITQDLSRRMRSSFTHESLLARYAV